MSPPAQSDTQGCDFQFEDEPEGNPALGWAIVFGFSALFWAAVAWAVFA